MGSLWSLDWVHIYNAPQIPLISTESYCKYEKKKSLDLQIFMLWGLDAWLNIFQLCWEFGDMNRDLTRATAKEWWNRKYVHTHGICKKTLVHPILPSTIWIICISLLRMVLGPCLTPHMCQSTVWEGANSSKNCEVIVLQFKHTKKFEFQYS